MGLSRGAAFLYASLLFGPWPAGALDVVVPKSSQKGRGTSVSLNSRVALPRIQTLNLPPTGGGLTLQRRSVQVPAAAEIGKNGLLPPTILPILGPLERVQPLDSPETSAKPRSQLDTLKRSVQELSAKDADRQFSLRKLFAGSREASGDSDLPSSSGRGGLRSLLSLGRWNGESAKVFKRVRSYQGKLAADARLELVPYLDELLTAGLLTTAELRTWNQDLTRAAMKAVKQPEAFKLLASKLAPEDWKLENLRTAEALAWAWERASESPSVRYALAMHPLTPEPVLRALSEDKSPDVRAWIAHNPRTPPDVLLRLARDEAVAGGGLRVREYAAANPSLSRRAGGRGEPRKTASRRRVRSTVYDRAKDPETPEDALRQFAKSGDKHLLMQLARNPSTPADILKSLAARKDPQLEWGVAGNRSTPPETLRMLARSKDGDIRRRLAENPSLPKDLFPVLFKDASADLKNTLEENPAFPRDVLGRPAWLFPSPALDAAGLKRLVGEVEDALRFNERLVHGTLGKLGISRERLSALGYEEERAATLPEEGAFTTLWEEREAAGRPPFKNIVIDVRGSRGGRGDVAAGYLTAIDILERAQRARGEDAGRPFQITLLMDGASRRILGGLMSRKVSPGESDFDGRLLFHTLDSLPASFPVTDLYLAVASPSGTVNFSGDLKKAGERSWLDAAVGFLGRFLPVPAKLLSEQGVPVDDKTVVLVQTVLGNTENPDSRNPFALLKIGDRELNVLPAGLAAQESGVYSDHVAWSLRGKTAPELREFLLGSLGTISRENDRKSLQGILEGSLLAGGEPGLVYGISMDAVKPQFESYLKGLAAAAKASGKSYTLITPSGFKKEEIEDKDLRERVEVIMPDEELSVPRAEPGKIYVVRTHGLPHPVFIGLMAYARPPPIVAGDGAMSAAIVLGRPFVMTRVGWNARNIENFKERLAAKERSPEARALWDAVYGDLDLSRALELEAHAARFHDLAFTIAGFTSNILAAARAAASLLDLTTPIELMLPYLPDRTLKLDVLLQRARLGDERARELFASEYLRTDHESRRRLDKSIVGNGLRRKLQVFYLRVEFLVERLLPGYFTAKTEPVKAS